MTKWIDEAKTDREWFQKRVEKMDALRAQIAAELAQEKENA